MNKMCKVFAVLAGAMLLAAVPSSVFAICSTSQPLWNGGGGFFTNCPDANPIAAYAYVLADPSTNTAGSDFICRDGSASTPAPQSVPCQPEAGIAGDGNVTVQFNWAGLGGAGGCPNSLGNPDVGRNVLHFVANNGASINLSVNYEPGSASYLVEGAMPSDDGFTFPPISCTLDNAPALVSTAAGPGTSVSQVCVRVPQPHVLTDCDPGTLGANFLNACANSPAPSVAMGRVFTTSGPCGKIPDPRLSAWTTPVTPDGTGLACLPVNAPPGQCAYVGVSGLIGGVETAGVLGSLSVGGAAVASPKVIIDRISHAAGKVNVDFHTTSEQGVIGFNVIAGRNQLNAQMIAATGKNGAGAKYRFEVARGALRNARTIIVQMKTSDGGTTDSAPAALSR